jgi:hypothetical protein
MKQRIKVFINKLLAFLIDEIKKEYKDILED